MTVTSTTDQPAECPDACTEHHTYGPDCAATAADYDPNAGMRERYIEALYQAGETRAFAPYLDREQAGELADAVLAARDVHLNNVRRISKQQTTQLAELYMTTRKRAEQAEDKLATLADIDRGYCPHCGRGDAGPTADMYVASERRAVRIQQLLDGTRARVRKLHRPVDYGGKVICAECSAYDGQGSTDNWPVDHAQCSTLAALKPPKGSSAPDAFPQVQGYCPACRGESLFLGSGGYVTCARIECPDPEAATRALEQRIDYSKIRYIAQSRPACPEGRHVDHPGYTCDDAEELAAAGRELLDAAGRAFDAAVTDPPAALRGPNWKAKP